MNKILEDALKSTIKFIGDSISFIVGVLGAVFITAVALSGELVDDIPVDSGHPVPWRHIAKVMIPPCGVAVGAYLRHRSMMADAINSPARPPHEKATIINQ